MTTQEKVLLCLSFIALVAVIIWRERVAEVVETNPFNEVGVSITPANTNMESGPRWLTYNQSYGFMPPINNFLPTITVGQEGQTVQNPLQFIKRMGVMMTGKDK